MPYQKYIETVPGSATNKIFLFTLSTCVWCKKTKQLLKDLGLEYQFVDVDLLGMTDQISAYNEIEKYNPKIFFPTIIINDGQGVISGFNEEKIKALI
ncbi:MAG: glutaredoxin family protein [Candidatus Paceibacterota bacterium]|jgi:glutaredoxin|nr:glutaredoxin family protein [bacterium]